MKISCAACVVATIGLLGGSPAYAKGLRGFEVGDPCMAAYEAEIAQGSQPTRPLTEMAADPLASFRGSHDGHAALIGYSCVDGLLTSQLITLKFESESNAERVLDEQYEALVALFGAPCTDWRKLSLWHRFKLWLMGIYYPDVLNGVDWDLGSNLQLHLYIDALRTERDSWNVTISVSSPPPILRTHPDGSTERVETPNICLHGD